MLPRINRLLWHCTPVICGFVLLAGTALHAQPAPNAEGAAAVVPPPQKGPFQKGKERRFLPLTVLDIHGTQFAVNGQNKFLYGISYYAGIGASQENIRRDLDEMQKLHFNWLRVWATWAAFDNDVSVVDTEGNVRNEQMERLRWLVAECDRRRFIVDVTISRGNGVTGPPRLQTVEAHRRAVENIVRTLRPYRNWYLDLSNERNIKDKRHTTFEELRELRAVVRSLDPRRLVTASHAGDIARPELKLYLKARMDFLTPHRPRREGSISETETKTREWLADLKESGRTVPILYQEPFRRGFGDWEPKAGDYLKDAMGAREGGAAGWCFHNGDQRNATDGRPRRSFDLQAQRLFDQLDGEERRALELLAKEF